MIQDSYEKIFQDKNRVMVVFAHPDDAELYCGGTIARLTADQKEVCVIKVTSGNKGSRQESVSEEELRKTRVSEDSASMKVLGIKPENNRYLGIGDGAVENTLEQIEKLAREIRQFRPDIIITHNPEDVIIRFVKDVNWVNHRDHRNTGKNTIDAAYPYSRDVLFFPEHFSEPDLASHTVTEFFLVDSYGHPDEVHVKVSDFIDIRNNALASHSSQYSLDDAVGSTDFFTIIEGSNDRWERFRYVVAD